jgi:tRNA threonylcarbamoyladenosine biosynthesis protein TsaE
MAGVLRKRALSGTHLGTGLLDWHPLRSGLDELNRACSSPDLSFFAKNWIYATIRTVISEQRTMINQNNFTTNSAEQTQKLGEILASELQGGKIICLTGQLGSGKTTFAQGVLKGLGAKGPYTSPTFVVMKHYRITRNTKHETASNVYHIDAYRVGPKDILDLGWEEIISGKKNIVIVEWAERIKAIVPKSAIWIEFKHLKDNMRELEVSSKRKTKNVKLQPKTKKQFVFGFAL